MTGLPIQADAPADTIKHTTPVGVGIKYCFRCYTESGQLVKSDNGRTGCCRIHHKAQSKGEGRAVCVVCDMVYQPVYREKRCKLCIEKGILRKSIKNMEDSKCQV